MFRMRVGSKQQQVWLTAGAAAPPGRLYHHRQAVHPHFFGVMLRST